MLELRNVTIYLKKDGRCIADEFNFTLKSGEKAAIIGEEGNGKSTLLKYVYNPNLTEEYSSCSGDVITRGKVSYLPQTMTKEDQVLSLMEYFESAEYYMYMDILAKLGLSLDLIMSDRKLGTLSGGERVKVQIAKLLMEEPDILLLDEPTNDLDIQTLQWLERFILESRIPILYVSHDETLIENTANVIIHMEQLLGKTQCRISAVHCSYRDYLSNRRSSFEHQEQVAKKQRENHKKQMERWRQIYNRVDHRQEAISRQDPSGARLLKKKMHSVISMGKRFDREKEMFEEFPLEEDAILAKFDENIRLPNGKTVLNYSCGQLCIGERILARNINLRVSGNEHIGITGRNGVGKSTLLACLWNELRTRKDINTAFMPQHYSDMLDFEKTPIEYLAENYTKDEMTKVRTFMGSMKFTREEMSEKIGNLSCGQQAKILFLDMILHGSNVLLLDEPTRNFSPLSCPVVRAALNRFGGAIISVSHDRKFLKEVCDKVYVLDDKGLSLAGTE